MPPPSAEQFASRILLGPALRAQPDRRLVALVRDGYEAAFEEIVRRYRRPLDRFAAAIVGGRSEDVTQDAFSKALLALRGSEAEIELRPWLYRIVRNTALNDLRDRPPAAEQLGEAIPGGVSAAAEAERREEIAELMGRLRALPEPQRAAIVMRELEGLSHEEIASALGLSGGAARQAIYRARTALRNGAGALVPLPLLRALFDHGAEAAGGATAAAGAAAAAGGGAGAALSGVGAGGALKIGLATALIAGSVGAGVAIQHDRGGSKGPETAAAATLTDGGAGADGGSRGSSADFATGQPSQPGKQLGQAGTGPGHGGRQTSDGPGSGTSGDGGGSSGQPSGGSHSDGSSSSGHHDSGHGAGGGGDSGHNADSGSHSGGGTGGEHSGAVEDGGDALHAGGDTSGSGGSGSGDEPTTTEPPPPTEPTPEDESPESQPSGSGSSGSGSLESGS